MKNEMTIDVINAAYRIRRMIVQGMTRNDAFHEVANKMDLTVKEMDQVDYLLDEDSK